MLSFFTSESFYIQFPCLFGVAVDEGDWCVLVGIVVVGLGRAFLKKLEEAEVGEFSG